MLEFEVEGRAELAAAVLAAAQPTFEAARRNPVTIRLLNTSCVYLFKEGIQEGRAERILKNLSRTPKGAFK